MTHEVECGKMVRDKTVKQRGYVMVFAVFLAVAIETVAVGNMANLMSFHRSADRILSQMRMTSAGDMVVDRALLLFRNYIKTTNRFPNTTSVGAVNGHDVVLGSHPIVTDDKTFPQFLSDWMEAPGTGLKSRYNVLHRVSMAPADVKIFELRRLGPDQREYEIRVTIHDTASQSAKTEVTQKAIITNGHLFDFSVFYNEDLEIGAGPDFTLQGPIFSNKNVYLMNDMGHTLTLLRASDFNRPDNSQRYVLNSAGNIYFYFKRDVARNYLLDHPMFAAAVPDYYRAPFNAHELELFPRVGAHGVAAPYIYYYRNGSRISPNTWNTGGITPGGDNHPEANVIVVENEDGNPEQLVPPHPVLHQHMDWTPSDPALRGDSSIPVYMDYTVGYGNPADSRISISTAWTSSVWPAIGEAPARNPLWRGMGNVVQDQVSTQTIPIGDPDNPTGPHILIEPLTGTPAHPLFAPGTPGTRALEWDTPETAALKLQSQADVNIFWPSDGTLDPGTMDLLDQGVISLMHLNRYPSGINQEFWDHRFTDNDSLEDRRILLLDIAALMAARPGARIVYVHTYTPGQSAGDMDNSYVAVMVMLVNGQRLPQSGFSVATNGRTWIRGDYNTFDYAKNRPCTSAEWESGDCRVPPAAILSDSLGVLANDWESHYAFDQVEYRQVGSDVMVNTAVATGYLPSQLKETSLNLCNADMSNSGCLDLTINESGQLNGDVSSFNCPNHTYVDGIGINDPECEYYRELPDTSGPYAGVLKHKYYVNARSDLYQQGVQQLKTMGIDPASRGMPECNPAIDSPQSPVYCNHVAKIPIFIDNAGSEAVIPVHRGRGIYYTGLYRSYMAGEVLCDGNYVCADGSTATERIDADHCDTFIPAHGEQTEDIYSGCQWLCADGNPRIYQQDPNCHIPPIKAYAGGRSEPLWKSYYSGGLENLVNLQEDWSRCPDMAGTRECVLRFSGTLTAPWFAKELGSREFYGTPYYVAPERHFDFNELLKDNPPPGTPAVFSIKRGEWKRRE